MRFFIPFILIAVAIVGFFSFTSPRYREIKQRGNEKREYEVALANVRKAESIRDELVDKRNSFKAEDLERLKKFLPDNIDNIRLLLEINAIASAYDTELKGIVIGQVDEKQATSGSTAPRFDDNPLGSLTLRFAVTLNYEDFVEFLKDIEHSLRLSDITSVGFVTSDAGGPNTYTVSLRTYWL